MGADLAPRSQFDDLDSTNQRLDAHRPFCSGEPKTFTFSEVGTVGWDLADGFRIGPQRRGYNMGANDSADLYSMVEPRDNPVMFNHTSVCSSTAVAFSATAQQRNLPLLLMVPRQIPCLTSAACCRLRATARGGSCGSLRRSWARSTTA